MVGIGKQERTGVTRDVLAQMRTAYAKQQWETVGTQYASLSATKPGRGVLAEAGYMAVSAAVASKNKRAARKVLATLLENDYPKAVHYEFVARACLELKQYGNALRAIAQAEALQKAEADAA
jgi:hypothetical protein